MNNKLRLDIWMRYDHTVPVVVPMLERLLRHHSDNVYCKLIPDFLHSKVIWWKGYGAYIGSANHTDRAWLTNIEAGLFLTEEDLESNGMIPELETFFDYLNTLDKAFPLTREVVEEMKVLQNLRRDMGMKGADKRRIPLWEGPSFIQKQRAADKQKENFQKEWHSTLTELRSIASQLTDYRPAWVEHSIPPGWQVDQFLHAYYYNKVGEGNKKPYEDYYQSNKSNPQTAVREIMEWWKIQREAPSNEHENLYVHAPYIREHLAEDKILTLSKDEFEKVLYYTHATCDHIIKLSTKMLGRPDVKSMSLEDRLPLFTEWLLAQRNEKGWDVRKLLHFVLYEGRDEDLWERLYLAGRTREYGIAHYGLNSIAELVGWARPEVAPPRNGRTSKALRALGFDVRVY
ncbi:phospholipase D-like domain-containing protein [Endozoicomonas lisbonensis]|uniref:phospholipase D-like domain-containing protein n=1 Tax=Endozoicomonas lisbonensis TaxID=3120522 RepID=UPI003396746C